MHILFKVHYRLKDSKKVAEPPITGDMIDAQGMVFLTAGFETTANTLGSLIFHLATHPDVQSKGNGVSSGSLWGLFRVSSESL